MLRTALIAKHTGWSRAEIHALPFAEFKAYVELFEELSQPPRP